MSNAPKPALYRILIPAIALLLETPSLGAADYPVKPVPFTDVSFTAGLWHDRQEINNMVTLPFALAQCDSSKRLLNFDLATETMKRRAAGETDFQNTPPTQYPFDDSDVFKVLEGAAFCLSVRPDAELQKRLEAIIARIAAAQEPDGYIYTWRTMHPDSPAHDWIDQKRWLKDPILSHELYNIGHLYEAGTAYEQATKSNTLLEICLKSAELLQHDFGKGDLVIAPGHEVIEMGLAKLYRQTGDTRWLDLATFFLDARGHGGSEYNQNHKPVIDQHEAVGHAVRANYLYSGMADVAALKGDKRYLEAITAIWDNIVGKKLHLTGGCGVRESGEAYGDDYELQSHCYNETCAAIAFLFWNHRMFLMTGDAKYMDVFERSLYNGFLSGVSLSGDRFFYPNPLEYDGREVNNHGHAGRAPWFGCACCPPNVLRTMASLGAYAYAVKDDQLFVNLYAQGDASAEVKGTPVKVSQQTNYPWDGSIKLAVSPAKNEIFTLCLRIPGWVRGRPLPSDLYTYDDPTPATWTVRVNGTAVKADLKDGFARIGRTWNSGDVVELGLPMPVRRVAANPKVAALRGKIALERGPVVYAFEGIDNNGSVFDITLPASARVNAVAKANLLGGVTVLEVAGAKRILRKDGGGLGEEDVRLTAIPYASWNNRGLSPMAVWIGRDAEHVRPVSAPNAASKAKVGVSFFRADMDTSRINDQQMPRNATDGFAPNFDFWPHKGGTEWISYEFEKPVTVKGVTISWFDDTGKGECRLPKSWRLFYQNSAGAWKPAQGAPDYAIRKADPVKVRIQPVTTRALRIELDLADGFSAGVYEWEVDMGK
ncbi:MAG: beta-L-arabinofuranosidase domain-containing protein [Luteolibacter sp.]